MASTLSSEVTVSGARCRPGSRCRPHRELGYWYCEINEANNVHNWDYCCQPNSKCGFSSGFHYPWCYVGPEASEQWRPCSDRYAERPYAYLHRRLPPNADNVPAVSPSNSSRPLKSNNYDPIPVQQAIDSNPSDLARSNSRNDSNSKTRILVVTNCSDASFDALTSSLRTD